ncbi:MAG TPA: ribosome maturation factor RimM [Methylomirabilota bacterium]|jgi:16S rRNA processing protein RimM|nr:ribosome maturation factor RimM [Methylomirabilota bacterium]
MGETTDAGVLAAGGTGSLVAVGRIVRPQGRRGEVRVEPLTDAPERLADLRECWLVPPAAGERHDVEAVWFQGPVPVVKLAGSDTMTDAEALVGRLVTIPRASVRPLPPDRYYAFDLVGCVVETPEGMSLGTIREVLAGPEHDYWTVQRGDRAWSLPAVAALVERVDLAARRVVARPPEGLVELDA